MPVPRQVRPPCRTLSERQRFATPASTEPEHDSIPGMPGWAARPGYDLPTGIGTVDAALPFVTALARAAS
jgi:hypothetical protein